METTQRGLGPGGPGGPGSLAHLAHFHCGKSSHCFLINSLQFFVPGHKTPETPVCALLTLIHSYNNIVVVTEAFLQNFLFVSACPSGRTASVSQGVWTFCRILPALTEIASPPTGFPTCVEETRSNSVWLCRAVGSRGLCPKQDLTSRF